jgi:class I fructose-bisphosphate aldolase
MIHRTVESILSAYEHDSPTVKKSFTELFQHGALSGTGKLLISAVDQGFEHGPNRSFLSNPAALDPHYHYQLAIDAGLSAFAAPLGILESGAETFAGQIPLILKMNSGNSLVNSTVLNQAVTASVEDAVRLRCAGIGFTIYPGSDHTYDMYEELRDLAAKAKTHGLFVVVWSYPRGNMSTEGETALDVISYGAHMACLLGAHIVKVKVPTAHLEKKADKDAIQKAGIPIATIADRIHHVVNCCFMGRRAVIFSGGTMKGEQDLLEETEAIRDGGGFGSIVGRNIFQRPRQESLDLIEKMVKIYKKR